MDAVLWWALLQLESTNSIYSNEVEDKLNTVTQHCDIIIRSLTHLQSNMGTTLFPRRFKVMYPRQTRPDLVTLNSKLLTAKRGPEQSVIVLRRVCTWCKLICSSSMVL